MALDRRDCVPIPHPRALPIIGNALDLAGDVPILRLGELARQYGEIFSVQVGGSTRYFVSSYRLANEICDERRFHKALGGPLVQLRNGIGSGLFTAFNGEEPWDIAHRTLVPAFGPLNISGMFDQMKDIASQLVLKFARHGPEYKIPVAEDFTRLTLDTLALCAMNYRFNSFYTEDMHPFISSMVNFLSYGGERSKRPGFLTRFYSADETKWFDDIKYMRNLSLEIVRGRKEKPALTRDLLNAMVNGKDPKSGKPMTEESIIDNMMTFLIAGHETTSGMLSFAFYHLLKNSDTMRKAQQEVDEVIGKDSVRLEHLSKLPYITAILREAARLQPTAPAFSVEPNNEQGEVLGGKYFIPPGAPLSLLLPSMHRDPEVYGEDAEEFRPERMLDENFNKLPPNSWKPFGNGSRGCIGRPFAWQEMMLVVSMLLQYFNFEMVDPSYTLQIASTLTIKPKDFQMRATLREGWTARTIEQSLAGAIHDQPTQAKASKEASQNDVVEKGKPLTILYGSNSGTCEAFAQILAQDASQYGFSATKVDTLDSAKRNLPASEPVVIVTASYEGQPCDNASHFYNWLQNLSTGEKLKTDFAVFACGHSDWKDTFHRIPKSIDTILEKAGGDRICEMGSANAAKGDMANDFQTWEDEVFWPAMKSRFGGDDADETGPLRRSLTQGQNISIDVYSRRASLLRSDVSEAKVISNRTLTAPGVPAKKNIELQLPSAMNYRSGDYCAVLPLNTPEACHRVLTRFGLPWDAMLNIKSKTGTTLPTEHPVSAVDLFSAYVELSQPATKRNLGMLIEASTDAKTKEELQALTAEDKFQSNITDKRVSLLDLLERYPSIQLPLSAFVTSLISMRIRQYSISSSPLSDPTKATLTYAVLDEPSLSGTGRKIGVASTYLSHLQPGDVVHVSVKASHKAFHLPTDPENVPVIMIGAGAGIAPFRGFVQERAAQIASGRKLAPAHLYFGCRHPDKDDLYHEELDFWEKIGAVVVHRAYSQAPEQRDGYKHIDESVLADQELVIDLWQQGAKVYVCGSKGLGESVRQACLKIAKVSAERLGRDSSDENVARWFESMRNERYSTDVFA